MYGLSARGFFLKIRFEWRPFCVEFAPLEILSLSALFGVGFHCLGVTWTCST